MSIEEKEQLKTPEEKINELEKNLKKFEADKAKIAMQLENLDKTKRKDRHIADHLQKKSNEIDKSIEDIQKELRKLMSIKRNKKDREVDEIIGSLSNKRVKDTEKRKIKDEEVDEILNFLSGKKEKPRTEDSKITNDDVDEIINSLSGKKEKPRTEDSKITNDDIDEIIDSLLEKKEKNKEKQTLYRPKVSNSKAYIALGTAKGKINKILTYINNLKENISLDKIKGIINLRNNAKAKKLKANLMEKAKGITDSLTNKYQQAILNRKKAKMQLRNAVSKDKVSLFLSTKTASYTAKKGTKDKMKRLKNNFILGVALFGAIGSMMGAISSKSAEMSNNSIYGAVKLTPEVLSQMEYSAKLREENSKVENKNDNTKLSQDKKNTSNEKPSTKPVQNNNNNSKQNQSNSNKQEINNNNKKPSHDTTNNAKPDNNKNEIKKIYGGEISASENGIRTEEDILYAVKQIGWSEDRVENIKEMMPGLLKMQTDFDIDPLCALAVFQGESGCGTDYMKYGQYRLANIEYWNGEKGVIGYSITDHYGLHKDYSSAAYDFGNYLRNGPPYSDELPALTMKDLKAHGKYTCIFNNADTRYASIYNQLKKCLEKKIGFEALLGEIEKCTTSSDIKEMTDTITSSINMQKSANKEMSGR